MKFQIVHTTRYRYSQLVTLCHNEVHLCPRNEPGQVCETSVLDVDPQPARFHQRTDYFGNHITYFAVQEAHDTLTVRATSSVERTPAAPPDLGASKAWDQVAASLHDAGDEAWAARELRLDSPLVVASPALRSYAAPSFPPGRPMLEAVADLAQRIHRELVFTPDFTTVSTPLSEVLEHRRGVCQDFAHLGIGCLRSLGLPARYVSGYIETVPPPGSPRLQGADASHAWFAVFDPDIGWVEFDPTNNQFVAERHVTVAWGRDYSDVTPLKGVVFGGGTHTLEVEVDMITPGVDPT
jgi:transglutaminase-like putative cysteine protease